MQACQPRVPCPCTAGSAAGDCSRQSAKAVLLLQPARSPVKASPLLLQARTSSRHARPFVWLVLPLLTLFPAAAHEHITKISLFANSHCRCCSGHLSSCHCRQEHHQNAPGCHPAAGSALPLLKPYIYCCRQGPLRRHCHALACCL